MISILFHSSVTFSLLLAEDSSFERNITEALKRDTPPAPTEDSIYDRHPEITNDNYKKKDKPLIVNTLDLPKSLFYLQNYERNITQYTFYPVGLWIPTGANKILGLHPEIGFSLGSIGLNNTLLYEYHLVFMFKYLKSENEFIRDNDNTLSSTDSFFGGYFGLEFSLALFYNSSFSFNTGVGIGYDGFDTSHDEEDSKSINSFNFNAGFDLKFYDRQYVHIIRTRYNVVDYDNGRGTDLSGHSISISYGFGVLY